MEDYWVWGSSVVKDDTDGLYHMFVSRWPKRLPFHPGWMVASEVVHAVSEAPEGPYRFSDVALGLGALSIGMGSPFTIPACSSTRTPM